MIKTYQVKVGSINIGSDNPVVVQSMTDTDTADATSTTRQIIELAKSGSEIVRLTVNNPEAAASVPKIKEGLINAGYNTPLVGCFHYNGHFLLKNFPEMARALDKYRINPGNVGQKDENFAQIIQIALQNDKPVRIGVNWGSLEQDLLTLLMNHNKSFSYHEVVRKGVIVSALANVARAEKLGMPLDKIIISAKTSNVKMVIKVYQDIVRYFPHRDKILSLTLKELEGASEPEFDYNYKISPLHLGLTEAGSGIKGIVASAIPLGILLHQGIGNTIRVSITPGVGKSRTEEVKVCREILQALELRAFAPEISSCPGCGRTEGDLFRHLAAQVNTHLEDKLQAWRQEFPGIEKMKVAVMGCVVNGPGESKYADIGISLPGRGENPSAVVYIDGAKAHILRGDNIANEFLVIVEDYVKQRFSTAY